MADPALAFSATHALDARRAFLSGLSVGSRPTLFRVPVAGLSQSRADRPQLRAPASLKANHFADDKLITDL